MINSKLIWQSEFLNSGDCQTCTLFLPSGIRRLLEAPLRLPKRLVNLLLATANVKCCFWPLAEFLVLSSQLSDVGLCPRALGSGSGAVQMGPPCHLHPRLSGKAAFGNCQVKGPCEVSRVSGAPAKRRAGPAGTDPQDPLCPERRAKHR